MTNKKGCGNIMSRDSQAKTYEIIRSLNAELKEKGFYVLQGKINKDYFEERFYGKG